jgi:hypothetical protein
MAKNNMINLKHFMYLSQQKTLKISLYFVLSFFCHFMAHAITPASDSVLEPVETVKSAQKDWHVYLQAPKQTLWHGQASQWLIISLNPPRGKATFDLPKSESFSFLRGATIAVNEGEKTGWAYPVNVIPKKSGTLKLPAFTLSNHSKSLSTLRQQVLVNEPKVSDRMQLDISINQHEIYIGQSVRLTASWTVDYPISALKAVNLHLPALLNDTFTTVQPWNKVDENSQNSIGLPVNGTRQIAHWQNLPNNQLRIFFDMVIKPSAAGQYHFSPATLMASVEDKLATATKRKFKGTQYRAYYNNQFFESTNDDEPSHPVLTKSSGIELNVKPLPLTASSKAPTNFSGIIGRPIIEASALPIQVQQGEPIQYTLNIVHPDIETLTLPTLSQNTSFTQSFDIPGEASISLTKSGSKIINQSLFPRRADIPAIPAMSINYFEPQSGLYRDLLIESLPIVVTENDDFNFSAIEGSKNIRLKNDLKRDNEGVWALRWQKVDKINDKENEQLNRFTNNQWLLLFLLLTPPLIVGALFIKPMHQRLHKRRAIKPIYQLKNDLNQGGDPLLPLSRYCYNRLGLAPSRFNADNIKQCLAPYVAACPTSSSVASSLSHWVDQYQTRYAQQHSKLEKEDITQLLIIVDALEKCLPRYPHNDANSTNPLTKANKKSVSTLYSLVSTAICVSALLFSMNSNPAKASELQSNKITTTITIDSLHIAHQQALQLSIDSPHKAHTAHAKIAQQLTNFVDDPTLNHASLLYDIGSSWFHAGRYGQSILWLLRAQAIAPNDAMIKHNLAQARSKRLDQLPDNFAPQWLNQLHIVVSHPLWLVFCWLSYAVFWLTIWRRFTYRDVTTKKIQFALIIVCLAGLSQLAHYQFSPVKSQAVVTSQDVVSRKGPGLIFSPAFTTPLHEGTELVVQRSDGQWSEVRLSNNTICWIPTRAFTSI